VKKEYINILFFFLDLIKSISDKKHQEEAWIKGVGPACDSFDEIACVFFEEYDEIKKDYQKYGISDSQYLLLNQFCKEFEAFSDEHDWPHLFIDTAEWAHIMNLAKEVLVAFNYKEKQ
jgi:hypothetical protein